jgi:hypothetical protein
MPFVVAPFWANLKRLGATSFWRYSGLKPSMEMSKVSGFGDGAGLMLVTDDEEHAQMRSVKIRRDRFQNI